MQSLVRRHRPSPALVVACLALLVALGGTGYAAFKLPAGSVGARQLKKNAVVNKKIAPSAVTGAKVKDDSLTGADVLESSLGKVPGAARADSAASADNATHAGSAANADNAIHAMAATSATTAEDAKTLGGYAANRLTRIAYTSTDGPVTLTTADQIDGPALSITAPAPGFVLVTGSVHMVRTTACTTGCFARADIFHLQTQTGWGDLASLYTETHQHIPLAWVFPVSAGPNSFALHVWRDQGNGTLQALLGALTAIYSPFGPTGGTAVK